MIDGAADKRGITVGHLFHHTAGFPRKMAPDNEVIDGAAYLRRLWTTPLSVRPRIVVDLGSALGGIVTLTFTLGDGRTDPLLGTQVDLA